MKYLSRFAIPLAFIAASSCASSRIDSIGTEPIHFSAADLDISLTYITPQELEKLHGTNRAYLRINPYVDFPALMTPKRFVVFNFSASSTTSTIDFTLEGTRLEISGVSGDAKSQGYLTKIWEIHTNQEGMEQMVYTMRKTLLSRKFTVSPDEPVEGYLIFGENYSNEGREGMISFSVSSRDGSIGLLEIPLALESPVAANENTGIFSQNP